MMDASAGIPEDGDITTDRLLSGAAPSLTLRPRPQGAASLQPPLSLDAVRAHANAAPLPPPRRRLLEGLALLWHDHWEAAHAIAQSHEGQVDYDLLHAIGHRREGDYPNAEYWFRSVGRHPSHAILERSLSSALPAGDSLVKSLMPGGRWSPGIFVAEVGRVALRENPGKEEEILVGIQALEIRAFSDWLLTA